MAPMVSVPMKNMVPLPQETSTTCWYTCLRMMFMWKGRDPAEIRPALVNAGILWEDACQSGLKTRDYLRAAKALGLRAWGTGSSWSGANFASFCTISPVWVAGKWYDHSHNVVVTAASRDEIKFIDPWWEGAKEASISTKWAKDFIKGNGADKPGTDFYLRWIGAVMAWDDAVPYGVVPE